MTVLEYYFKQQLVDCWYEKFYSTSDKKSGKTFSFMSTNFRSLYSFLNQIDRFRSKIGIDRKAWNDKLPCGQELDKHRIIKLIQSGFIINEDNYYYLTYKGITAIDLINSNLSLEEKWIVLYLLLLDYRDVNNKLDIVDTTKKFFLTMNTYQYSNDYILGMLRKSLNLFDKSILFTRDIFWLITFVNDGEFLNLFTQSSKKEKEDLINYVISCSANNNSKDLIAHKFVNSGVYSVKMFHEDISILYYTYFVIQLLDMEIDDLIGSLINEYCNETNHNIDNNCIIGFIYNHKSVFEKILNILKMEEV